MTRNLVLPDFTQPAMGQSVGQKATATGPVLSEDEKLAAFDRGYKSGWDDCATAEAEERGAIGADLARTISDASVTYEGARREVLSALGPLFDEIVATLLPQMAAAAVAPAVLEELTKLAESHLGVEVELHAAPTVCASLQMVVEKEHVGGLTVRPEPAFSEGQVSIRFGNERRDIDMTDAASRIANAISQFHSQITEPEQTQATLTEGAV